MGLWLPRERAVIRPPTLSRRGFLRAAGVTALAVAVPSVASTAVEEVGFVIPSLGLVYIVARLTDGSRCPDTIMEWTAADGTKAVGRLARIERLRGHRERPS